MYKLSSRIDNMGRDKSINLRKFALGQILFHHHRSKKGRFEEKQTKNSQICGMKSHSSRQLVFHN